MAADESGELAVPRTAREPPVSSIVGPPSSSTALSTRDGARRLVARLDLSTLRNRIVASRDIHIVPVVPSLAPETTAPFLVELGDEGFVVVANPRATERSLRHVRGLELRATCRESERGTELTISFQRSPAVRTASVLGLAAFGALTLLGLALGLRTGSPLGFLQALLGFAAFVATLRAARWSGSRRDRAVLLAFVESLLGDSLVRDETALEASPFRALPGG